MKNIFKVVFLSSIFFLLIYLIISFQVKNEISADLDVPSFFMEIQNIKLRNWDKENVLWEIQARGAVYYDNNNLIIKEVTEGNFYDKNGDNIFEKFIVATVNANINRDSYTFNDAVIVNSSEISSNFQLKAKRLFYKLGELISEDYFLVKIYDWKISSKKMIFSINDNQIIFNDSLEMINSKDIIKSKYAKFYLNFNKIILSDNVNINKVIKEENEEYTLKVQASEAEILFVDDDFNIVFRQKVRFILDSDVIDASIGEYDSKTEKAYFQNANIFFNEASNIIKNIDSNMIKGSKIESNDVSVNFKEKIVELYNGVSYYKESRTIKANRGIYDVKKGMLIMKGNVSIIEHNKVILSEDLSIDVKNDVIIAKGRVRTKVKF
jgi:lipopolysaccharide export system protein LptA